MVDVPILTAIDQMMASDGKAERKMKWLYEVLSIIDSKAAHLLSLNALVLTAETFLLRPTMDAARGTGSPSTALLILLPFVFPIVAVFNALGIFDVAWRFLGWPGREKPNDTIQDEFEALAKKIEQRTATLKRVRRLTILAVVSLIAMLFLVEYLVVHRR